MYTYIYTHIYIYDYIHIITLWNEPVPGRNQRSAFKPLAVLGSH